MRFHSRIKTNPLFSFLNPFSLNNFPNQKLSKTLTLAPTMASSRRATCPSCSKPTRLCLCTRIKNPKLNNSIAIIILQHILEQKHPLNSTRIAALGLKNVSVVTVSDVNFEARFVIRPIQSNSEMGFGCSGTEDNGSYEKGRIQSDSEMDFGCLGATDEKWLIQSDSDVGSVFSEEKNKGSKEKSRLAISPIQSDSDMGINCFEERNNVSNKKSRFSIGTTQFDSEMGSDCLDARNNGSNEKSRSAIKSVQNDFKCFDSNNGSNEKLQCTVRPIESDSELGFNCLDQKNNRSDEKSLSEGHIEFLISKYGVMNPDFDLLFGSSKVHNALAKGFVVKKWNNKLVNGRMRHEKFEEFKIIVPFGSALLFPSENSVGIEAINFEVKNLIVLDGTWAKAKRIYSENPWLKVLPHLKLDLDKMSLYSEVRHQPKVGYLSTIESIVYAMKGLGDQTDGFYHLLEVFESMVGDQRRCKDERLSKFSMK